VKIPAFADIFTQIDSWLAINQRS